EYFSKLLDQAPDAPLFHHKMGVVRLMEKKEKEAVQRFEKALELNPDFVPALTQLVTFLARKDGSDRAMARCARQIEKSPNNP
ncbi:tetratricopeptide repeat protein, partial [Klebsiella variicola]|uniref:tetratricopeptide repeat protein n=1 Tax=Klebsiella variicola TaxID=244366 RepID=UPI002731B7A8